MARDASFVRVLCVALLVLMCMTSSFASVVVHPSSHNRKLLQDDPAVVAARGCFMKDTLGGTNKCLQDIIQTDPVLSSEYRNINELVNDPDGILKELELKNRGEGESIVAQRLNEP